MGVNARAGEEKPSLKITGSGSASGGVYKNIKVMGDAVIQGDVICDLMKLMGDMEIKGSLNAEDIKVMGDLMIVPWPIPENAAEQMGQHPLLKGESVKITGELEVLGDCHAEDLRVRGSLQISGMLSGEEIDIRLHGISKVREIGGSHITVKSRSSVPLVDMVSSGRRELKSELIEGDKVYLENTEAAVVRGGHVSLGPGCRVDLVEYRHTLELAKGASVGQERKLG
ncbi:hypothetical protein DCC85_19910 [Paenibacillus sp. CAA11]|uniref:hypothetical protein n=1 Tax=Paenibacillus sp. CAA11 TaxID=1532905 RepID=UPI000D3C9FBD|nr:hypothetical protein [Paenibacillus sp. CAA11]AWB46203.1 hypothetical protein DCC85_19910 [Paenibacillus sp. CAA11]